MAEKEKDNFLSFLISHSNLDESEFQLGDVARLDNETWTMETETNALRNGTTFYALRSKVHKGFDLITENEPMPGRFTSRFVESGAVDLRLPDAPRFQVTLNQGVMFSPKTGTSRAFYKGGTNINLVTYNASIALLERLMDYEPSPELEALLKEDHDQACVVPVPVSHEMRLLFSSTHSSELTGILRHIQLEGIAMHLLALQLHAINKSQGMTFLQPMSEKEERKTREAKEYLLNDLETPPTLGELAAFVEMSERQLNANLKMLYGATAFELLHNERLDVARRILESEEVLLKQVSHRVGYNHVTNFINAFTKRFGKPPRQYLDKASEE